MNEKIKELAEQAELNDTILFNKDKLEKFAELIVKKCAKVAWANTPDYEELEYVHLISDKIKEHFGVE